jgi:peptidoglycan/xylan/chitin deacetylase (PgdA/CDA1 family)
MGARDRARSLLIRAAVRSGLHRLVGRSGARGHRLVQLVNLHATPRSHADALRRQIEWVSGRFALIGFAELKAAFASPGPPQWGERPAVLFTFDDGLASQADVAAKVLEEFGTRGVFFVVPRFVGSTGDAAWRFFTDRIQRGDPGSLPDDMWRPMSVEHVGDLAARGHTIGSHTLSHSSLRTLSASEKQSEIAESALAIGRWTKRPVETFAWTFAWNTIDAESWRIALRTHDYCFAPCTGIVDLDVDRPGLIWRTHVEAWYGEDEYRFMYLGLADPIWLAGGAPFPASAPASLQHALRGDRTEAFSRLIRAQQMLCHGMRGHRIALGVQWMSSQ